MNEPIYTISQAASLVSVKSYVLRYWEEELGIPIARNEMGHRFYTGRDIQLFLNIKELKARGLQLKAIKDLIPKIYYQTPGSSDSPINLLPGQVTKENPKIHIFPTDNPQNTSDEIPKQNSDNLKIFYDLLEKLIAQELKDRQARNREEKCRTLDETIRFHQKTRQEVAATNAAPPPKSRLPFLRKKFKG